MVTNVMTPARIASVVVLQLALLAGCGGGSATTPTDPVTPVASLPVLTAMTVSLSTAQADVGRTLSATVLPIDEKGRSMTVGVIAWSTSNPSVATVSPDGLITATTPGQTLVVARVGTVQGQATLVVAALPPGPAPVATVTVSPGAASVEAGTELQLTIALRDFASNALSAREVLWASSEPNVATVSPNGFVTALSAGTAIIEATSESRRGAMVISVTAAVDTEIVVNVMVPVAGAVVGDTLDVVSTVRSLFPITSVVASAGGQQAALTFGPIGGEGRAQGWSTLFDVSTLPFGAYTLLVTATDNRGHRGLRAVAFVRNPRVPGGAKPPSGSK